MEFVEFLNTQPTDSEINEFASEFDKAVVDSRMRIINPRRIFPFAKEISPCNLRTRAPYAMKELSPGFFSIIDSNGRNACIGRHGFLVDSDFAFSEEDAQMLCEKWNKQ